jgi:trehalose/maltose transport system substrate-binding protein
VQGQDKDRDLRVARAYGEFFRGKISRREMLKRAAAAGATASTMAMLAGGRSAFAQDATPGTPGASPVASPGATPGATGTPGSTIVVPAGLRTDLSGQRISAILASPTEPILTGGFLGAAMARFTEATGIAVDLPPAETQSDARLQAYRQLFAAQSTDVHVYQIDVIWPGIVAEFATDLNPVLGEQANQHFGAIVENNTVDGALVAMPYYTDAGLLYYRTDLLEQYGFSAPPATWDELQQQAQTIQDGERAANPQFAGFVFQGRAYEGLTCNGLEWQVSNGGGTIVEPDGTVSVNNPRAIESFDRARGWIGTISPEAVSNFIEDDCVNTWTAGNAAFMRNWPYAYSASQAAASAVAGRIDVTLLPAGTGDEARNADTLGGWNLMVSRFVEGPQQEAAVELVKYLTSPELQRSLAIEISFLPTIGTVYEDPAVAQASEFIPRLREIFEGGAVARPSSQTGDLYAEVSTVYYQQLNAVLTGSQDGATAAATMEEEISAIVEEG